MLSKKIVKYIQSLSHKKLREGENRFIAEGPKVVAEFLKSGTFRCFILCATPDWLSEQRNLLHLVSAENIYETDEITLQKISLLKTANKIVAVFEKKIQGAIPAIGGIVSLMLDEVRDPGNMGTIIRIADWFGIENIICSENCVDCYNPKVVQAAMGSLARVNLWYTSLDGFLENNRQISVYAASLSGTPLPEVKKCKEGIIIIGNESTGISESILDKATRKITIPRYGHAESLNAAVATGIILSHVISPVS